MQLSALFALASVMGASAMPGALKAKRQDMMGMSNVTDTQVLQYALTLENLENKFYADALDQFSAEDFSKAGYPDWVRGRMSQIASHESSHVELLAGALGDSAVQPCEYKFPYTDVNSFLGLAHLIENVGTSAYLGAAQYITDKTYLTIAGSILTVEARHQGWQSSAVLKAQPWQGPYDTPLGLDMVYTIASAFITSCPDSNAMLPVQAFPALTVSGNPGDNVEFSFDSNSTDTKYAVFYSGLGMTCVQLDENNMATIPSDLQGIYYTLVSTAANATDVSSSNIVAGPAILEKTFDAWTENPAYMPSM